MWNALIVQTLQWNRAYLQLQQRLKPTIGGAASTTKTTKPHQTVEVVEVEVETRRLKHSPRRSRANVVATFRLQLRVPIRLVKRFWAFWNVGHHRIPL